MKKGLLIISIVLVVSLVMGLFAACDTTVNNPDPQYTLSVKTNADLTLTVGDTDIDFTQYFSIVNKDGDVIVVTADMLDVSQVNTTAEGTFNVVLTYHGISCTATFTVQAASTPAPDLAAILAGYANVADWNFVADLAVSYAGVPNYTVRYGLLGDDLSYTVEPTAAGSVTDYLEYVAASSAYVYYKAAEDGSGSYSKVMPTDDLYNGYVLNAQFIDLSKLTADDFAATDDGFAATDPVATGEALLGKVNGRTYTAVTLTVADGHIAGLTVTADEKDNDNQAVECVRTYTLSGYGTVDFDLTTLIPSVGDTTDLTAVFAQYDSYDKWNFVVHYAELYDGQTDYEELYTYVGDDIVRTYDAAEGFSVLSDYLLYNATDDYYTYYQDMGLGNYVSFDDDTDSFATLASYFYMLELTTLGDYTFDKSGDHYNAADPQSVGTTVVGDFGEYYSWTSVSLYIEDGRISRIDAVLEDLLTFRFDFVEYGTATIDATAVKAGSTVGESGAHSTVTHTSELQALFPQYDSYDKWNFVVDYYQFEGGAVAYQEKYLYLGDDLCNQYTDDYGDSYVEYLEYDANADMFYYYVDNLDGTYTKLSENDDEFYDYYYYLSFIELGELSRFAFVKDGDHYKALNAESVGGVVLGAYSSLSYTSVELYIQDGRISEISAVLEGYDEEDNLVEYVISYQLSGYGTVNFDLTQLEVGGDTPVAGGVSTTFTDSKLSVGSGELAYTASRAADGFDTNGRGVQFTQKNGAVTLTSAESVGNVTSVSVNVSTNLPAGMKMTISVGDTALLYNGQTAADVAQGNNSIITFVAPQAASGNIIITLTPNGTSKSMYILTVTLNEGATIGGGQVGPVNPPVGDTVMENQTYNPDTFDNERYQDKEMTAVDAIGLPSVGTYHALVVPVQLQGTTITQAQLDKLNAAFNGTADTTGWESVSSYYKKASYDKLNITFDIQNVYSANYNADYYATYSQTDSQGYPITGDTQLLMEVLAYYEPLLDLTKYDTNQDGCIDAVYLIYSAPVDYVSEDSFYWAYVTWYYGDTTFDGLDAYYYLFAGIDFMDENTPTAPADSQTEVISGLSVNASTYIHETGHLLGLDDYYDYAPGHGSDLGLGGADMMDYTVGDHCSFSKTMLGWIDPTVITQSDTYTISSFSESGNCLLVPLSFDNSYFGEYLLIDLYSNTGLNAMHAAMNNSDLFYGAEYGVRIYHVSAQLAATPYEDEDYPSLFAYNNSFSTISQIRLVEADGEYGFASTDGYSDSSDLWQTGDTLGTVFAGYTRNDGKKVNFDISIDAVTADSATITITFVADSTQAAE